MTGLIGSESACSLFFQGVTFKLGLGSSLTIVTVSSMSKLGSKVSGSSGGGSSERADASKDGLSGSGGGGVGVRSSAGLFKFPCDLDFLEMSDLVHDLDFFDFDCLSVSASANSSPSAAKVALSTESGDVGGEGSREGSEMLDRKT